MAKLSAYGRTELWRLAKDQVKYAAMSDGRILKNYGSGWKVVKLKEGLTQDDVKRMMIEKGYVPVNR